MNEEITRKFTVADVAQLHVRAQEVGLLLTLSDGSRLHLHIPIGVDREIAHIMADGIRARSLKGFDPKSGDLLVNSQLQPARAEKAIGKLGLEEKFVLQTSSPGATTITHRLSSESVRHWIDEMEQQLALKGKRPRTSS